MKFAVALLFTAFIGAQGCMMSSQCGLGEKCRDGVCIDPTNTPGQCGKCGQPPINDYCCGSGVKGHDGNCYCAKGNPGCLNDNECGKGRFCVRTTGKCKCYDPTNCW
ncbi:hypothetical protein BJ944DRAFT_271325 [Cunninghamella echinulata]|nr:hypothetical protein BJ944DRAFT_271325 [Cunninghamella echinulata]